MKSIIPIILSILFLNACSGKIKIHEISKDLSFEETENPSDLSLSSLWKNGKSLLTIDSSGIIYRFDPESKELQVVGKSDEGIGKKLFSNKDKIVFQDSVKSKIIFINTKNLEIKKTLDNKVEKVIGLLKNIYISCFGNNLYVKNLKSGKTVIKLQKKEEFFFNSEIVNGKLVILGKNSLYIYSTLLKKFDLFQLSLKSSSPFLYYEGFIYYGSTKRFLVKYSLKKHKVIWKIKLPMKITTKIIKFNKYIVAIPEDNGIYFFTEKGSVYWWKKLDSEVKSDPIPMKKNIAVLLNERDTEKVVFLNPKKKTEKTVKLENITFTSTPVFFNGYIYSIAVKDKNVNNHLLRIGNKIGGIVKVNKAKKFEIGRSVKIEVKPVNMINPEIKISIEDQSGEKIFEKKLMPQISVSIAWIPRKEGLFKIHVTLTDKNISIKEDEIEVRVTDLKKIYSEYFIKLIDNCMIR